MNLQHIKQLVAQYPNDAQLGMVIRREIKKLEESNQIIKNPNQIDLEDMINEVQTSKHNGSSRL